MTNLWFGELKLAWDLFHLLEFSLGGFASSRRPPELSSFGLKSWQASFSDSAKFGYLLRPTGSSANKLASLAKCRHFADSLPPARRLCLKSAYRFCWRKIGWLGRLSATSWGAPPGRSPTAMPTSFACGRFPVVGAPLGGPPTHRSPSAMPGIGDSGRFRMSGTPLRGPRPWQTLACPQIFDLWAFTNLRSKFLIKS